MRKGLYFKLNSVEHQTIHIGLKVYYKNWNVKSDLKVFLGT